MWDCRIFLPTRGRVHNQVTLERLPDSVRSQITIACHPGEGEELEKLWGDKVFDIVEVEASCIGDVRQQCIDASEKDIIIFVDDGLDFHARMESHKGNHTNYPIKGLIDKHFTQETIDRVTEDIFRWLWIILEEGAYGMAGISRRSSNSFVGEGEYNPKKLLKKNQRICSFWSINRKLLNSLPGKPKFSDMQLKEDFYIVLNFLTNGIPVVVNYFYAYGRKQGANSPGGCSIYRNIESSNQSAYELKNKFPQFVNLSKKGVKSWGGDFQEQALDVRVDWAKAYKHGVNKRRGKHHKGFFV